MAATGTLGARLYIGTAPLVSIGTDAVPLVISDFQSLSYTEVGTIENMGEFGRLFELVTFNSVSSGRTQKIKGPFNDGQVQLGLGADLGDTGQALLKSYADAIDQNTYPNKITLVGTTGTWAFVYFGSKYMSFRFNLGQANSVIRAAVASEVNTAVFFGSA